MKESYSPFNKSNIAISMNFKTISRISDEKTDLMAIIYGDNPKALRDFYSYCAKEFSQENLICLMAINDYTKFPSWEKLSFIMKNFIATGAESEINIPSEPKKQLTLLVDLAKTQIRRSTRSNAFINKNSFKNKSPETSPPIRIFETSQIEFEVYKNLLDTYGRYEPNNIINSSFIGKSITYISKASEEKISSKDILKIRSMLFAGFNTLDVLLK